MPVLRTFAKTAFLAGLFARHMEKIYDTWNCDKRPCESCIEKVKNTEAITCTRSRILLAMSRHWTPEKECTGFP